MKHRWFSISLAAVLVLVLLVGFRLRTTKAAADDDGDQNKIVGLWHTQVSSPCGVVLFQAFEQWGAGGTFIGSGQTDLTPAALESSAWGVWKRIGPRKFHEIGRFWTYDNNANPTGFGAIDFTFTLSNDGNTYHGEGPTQFFDTNGNPLGPPSPTCDDGTRISSP